MLNAGRLQAVAFAMLVGALWGCGGGETRGQGPADVQVDEGGTADTGPDIPDVPAVDEVGAPDVHDIPPVDLEVAAPDTGPDTVEICEARKPPYEGDPPPAPTWLVGDPLPGLVLTGYVDPRRVVAPVATTGWEDCPVVRADGRELMFSYTRRDYDAVLVDPQSPRVTGPERPGHTGWSYDLYTTRPGETEWSLPLAHAVNSSDEAVADTAPSLSEDGNTLIFARYRLYAGPHLYLSERQCDGTWTEPTALPAPVNSAACADDNPALSADGHFLYFDSTRNELDGLTCDPLGKRRIWVVERTGTTWGTPELLPGTVNRSGESQEHPFVSRDDQTLFFAGTRSVCNRRCLLKSVRDFSGRWGSPAVVANPERPEVIPNSVRELGHPSTTADGQYLVFLAAIQGLERTDVEIVVARPLATE